MAESQSRYSIVERLTNSKLGLIDGKNGIESRIEEQKQEIGQKKRELEAYRKDAQEDMNRVIRKNEENIKALESALKFHESRKAQEISAFEDKIQQIEKALKAIEEISKTAPSPEQQVSRS